MKQILGCTIALLLAGAAQAGVREGVEAWSAGDYDKAIAEWREPAEKGDADAQFNLGQAYKLGRGVAMSGAFAQDWYLKAAKQGHAKAQANLGLLMYQNGEREGAMPWIRKAAERNEPRAMFLLASAMFNGDMAPRDWPRAYALMNRAKAAGLPQAADSLIQMDAYLSTTDKTAGLALAEQLAKGGKAASAVVSPPAPKLPALVRPAPAPAVAVVAAAATTPLPSGGWRVQLGAYGSVAGAEKVWAGLSALPELAGTSPSYEEAGKIVRLRAAPLVSRADATRACEAVRAAKRDCLPMAPVPATPTDVRP